MFSTRENKTFNTPQPNSETLEFLKKIEEKWQKRWEEAKIFEANPETTKPKYFITVAYPYPNSPQHIGHARTYTLADVHARYMRMRGYNVLLPMAFHYTGTPVLAMVRRLAENDEELIRDFVNIYKIPKEKLAELTDPLNMARYFHEEIKEGMKRMGFSIDWRREFTTIDPPYNRFIEWQFQKLWEKGYVTKGSHPVGWCPKCGNPVGQHDTIGDLEPEIGEFTLIKFRQNNVILPTATLRPETVFGVTNIWVNPNAKYVKANVNGEKWIVSRECIEKLAHLNYKAEVIETFEGKKLIGKYAENPVTEKEVLILPAEFVDPKNATGVVMSVPGHAPYDLVALENMKKSSLCVTKEYGIKPEEIEAITPILLIEVSGYSEFPAADIIKKMNIKNQKDAKLEEATKEVYRHEFHNGKMKSNTGKYSGLSVAEAKDKVKNDLIKEEKAAVMYELLNRPVNCRCGTECIVKILEDQWFIDYGNQEWKNLARKNLDEMEILPEELRKQYENVIDWLHEKACARKSGMGTKLPWDKEWIIESLSDSTIYMAYYTIVRHIKENNLSARQLTNEVFDYIFLGIGNAGEIAEKTRLQKQILDAMRREFLYFYPLDSRHSAHELIPNHLTFMIFNHTAIFPENLWPRQIVTNGHVLMEGAKMSKSFGNIIPLREGLAQFGADPIRLSVLGTAELLQDADFSPSVARSMREKIERLYKFVANFAKRRNKQNEAEELSPVDRWMLSRLQRHIQKTTEAMDRMAVRKAIQSVLFELDKDLQWYQKRTANEQGESTAYVLDEVINVQVRMLAPAAPHVCEELWALIDGKSFVSTANWPKIEPSKFDAEAEEKETLIMNVVEDTLNIEKATGITPKKIHYYTAASWKWKIYHNLLQRSVNTKLSQKDLMKELMQQPETSAIADKAAKFISQVIDEINHMSGERKKSLIQIEAIDEKKALTDARKFLERELKAEVYIYSEEDRECWDPKKRAQLAKPLKPAIYIE